MKDYFKREISVGDFIVYGKSSRHKPLNVGVVQEVTEDTLTVLGDGNSKPGEIRCHHHVDNGVNKRVVILPERLQEYLDE
ncbi:MAG: hypothetical protein Tp1111DCM1126091_33 [Prokaryotic dsDNA virus sp.]|nr:MAG: hypothetical protein Tp1111DCM1126091_33 [Prokaryotic dsDNA virus sp.]|tara:strand:+ start:85731 stop:85970 length:240 start_codon:yes stop_codon:yes gene_type:complete